MSMKNNDIERKYELIKEELLMNKGKNPITIAKTIMSKEYVNMHGVEHHFLDGGSFLVSFKNCGGDIDLSYSLNELSKRSLKMPGGMCGYWGVCGAVTSIGAALSIIFDSTPITNNDGYKYNMEYTSMVISKMSEIGGPRCCKRNAFLALSYAVKFIKEKCNIEMELDDIICDFKSFNKQCIGNRCLFCS